MKWKLCFVAAFLLFTGKYFERKKMYEEKLVNKLIEKNLTISTAESCTGGMIASEIINVAGASSVYAEGFITYANEAKMKYLGVKGETLEKYGAVSSETVYEMAEGCARNTGADVTVVTSGIAGPGGGTAEKPVGLVYFACFYQGNVAVRKEVFPGNRMEVRKAAADYAIKFVLDIIEN